MTDSKQPKPIPFSIPDISRAEIDEVVAALESGWITTGPRTKQFEQAFAERVGAAHGLAVNSCTAAMHLALEALGISPGDEVILPTYTFAATGEVVRYMGATPVLVDILASDHNIDPEAVQRAITPRTKAIIPVHFGGQACDMDALAALAREHDLALVEDAAHAFPTQLNGRTVGALGDVTCFSFYATKTLATGEGGMATTDREDLADRMRVMSLHGISKDAWKRYTAEGSWYYEIVAPGFKYNMTDIAAALGLVQLRRAEELLRGRRRVARRLLETLKWSAAVETLEVRSFDEHSWHLFLIRLRPEALSIDRARFIEEMKLLGVGTSVHFIPLHLHPYYVKTYGYAPEDFPVARQCYEGAVSLPIYSLMTDAQVDQVVEAVSDITTRFRR